jgi:predicted amidohydrolase YtcJ
LYRNLNTRSEIAQPAFLTVLGSAQAQGNAADIILVNANIFTGSDIHPRAESIAIRGDRVIAVDTTEKVSALAGPQTRKIDVAGRLVIPGILDTHIHYMLMDVVPDVTNIDFGGFAPSCKHVLETISEKIKDVPNGNLLFGFIGTDALLPMRTTPRRRADRLSRRGGTSHSERSGST